MQLKRNDVKVDGRTLREAKAENMSAESRFLVVCTRPGRRGGKSSTVAKTPLKSQNK